MNNIWLFLCRLPQRLGLPRWFCHLVGGVAFGGSAWLLSMFLSWWAYVISGGLLISLLFAMEADDVKLGQSTWKTFVDTTMWMTGFGVCLVLYLII